MRCCELIGKERVVYLMRIMLMNECMIKISFLYYQGGGVEAFALLILEGMGPSSARF